MKKLIIFTMTMVILSACTTPAEPQDAIKAEPTENSVQEPEKEVQKQETEKPIKEESQSQASAKNGWTLTSGTEPYPDISGPLVYEGSVQLKGWIVDVPFYVGAPEPHFHIADSSLTSLPSREKFTSGARRDFRLNKISPDRIEELRQYTSQNPAVITATKIIVNSEGNPTIEF